MDNKKLFEIAKQSYYDGEPILSDEEFDELENSIGLANNSDIGAKGKYTVKHSFLMGSLSKIHVTKDTDWQDIQQDILKYLTHFNNCTICEATPKYDGCSFELIVSKNGDLMSASTRGDGYRGQDLMPILKNRFKFNKEVLKNILNDDENTLIVRGEALIKISTFTEKYSIEKNPNGYANPRSCVIGIQNNDYSKPENDINMTNDIDYIGYDFMAIRKNNTRRAIYLDKVVDLGIEIPSFIKIIDLNKENKCFEDLYYQFDKFRNNESEYQLDGFVIKPLAEYRACEDVKRPKDSVAIKFIPQAAQTEIINIEWKLGHNYELYPTGIVKPVQLAGTTVTRVSLHNYGYLMSHNIAKGAIIEMVKSGDIIPYVSKVVKGVDNTGIEVDYMDFRIEGCHLYVNMSEDVKRKIDFTNSVRVLNIDKFKEKTALKIFEKYPMRNVLELFVDNKAEEYLTEVFGESKTKTNILNAIRERKETLSISDVILTLNIPYCGAVISKACEKYIVEKKKDFTSMSADAYKWVFDEKSDEYLKLMDWINKLQITYKTPQKKENVIYVILTGSPKEFGYNTKEEFIAKNPQFEITTKWKDCSILYTDDLNSKSSKMNMARKNNIQIKLYSDVSN